MSALNLPPRDAARLRRLVPLLGSNHDGEALAARNAIGRLLVDAGLDWHDLAAACAGSRVETPARSATGPLACDLARAVRDADGGRLTPKERAFVHDCCRRGFAWRPTPRQAAWLEAIHERLQPKAAA